MNYDQTLIKPTGRVLSTLEADGSRRWLYPRLSTGALWKWRRIVAWLLIAIFTLIPFVKVGGKPLVLLDIAARQFTLLGYTFLPRDTVLLALLMVSIILSIFFVTSLLGRAWCGWACPQTVYMEFVYRPVERLMLGKAGVGGAPRGVVAAWRVLAMHAAFLLISLYLAHTFLSYFVGVDQLRVWVTRSPIDHPWSFAVMALVTGLMMFDFGYFREQTCLIACPYGRLQSVLLDRNSLIIKYDEKRGEPRRRLASGDRQRAAVALPVVPAQPAGSDCVDCSMCVQVCPTGIDIRDGLQFECINCAQCIDVCNDVMLKVGRATGLIRYSSQNAMEGAPARVLRPRVIIYATLIVGLLVLLAYLVVNKPLMDVLVVRNGGLPFVVAPDGRVENTLRLQVTNRSEREATYEIAVRDDRNVEIAEAGSTLTLAAGASEQRPIHLLAAQQVFQGTGKHVVSLTVSDRVSHAQATRSVQLFGPVMADAVSSDTPAKQGGKQ